MPINHPERALGQLSLGAGAQNTKSGFRLKSSISAPEEPKAPWIAAASAMAIGAGLVVLVIWLASI